MSLFTQVVASQKKFELPDTQIILYPSSFGCDVSSSSSRTREPANLFISLVLIPRVGDRDIFIQFRRSSYFYLEWERAKQGNLL